MEGIVVKGIQKNFGKKTVLQDVDLQIKPGKIYGLLGRNGAGKSTLLSIIANRIFPNMGTITLDGQTVFENDKALGQMYLMSERNLYSKSSKLKHLLGTTELLYGNFDYEYAYQLAEKFSLDLNQKFGKLSTGYRSIFKLIVSLCVPAKYILLDEPVLGLDANHRELFYREMVDNYVKTGKTFVISTHLIEEITNSLEHIFIIKNGQIIIDGDVEDVLNKAYLVSGPAKEVAQYTAGLNVIGQEKLGNIQGDYVFGKLDSERVLPDTVTVEKPNLQKLFINLTNTKEENK
ncbi:ABC transporter ATP-binding protein [Liquorilactobacillus capillatus]|uniref:ABC transporter, ATP-binding protein n=1 Tax=Liquorilactobacillus capillatus DSM 19910 TaxID=1423731 RepID=A0A0R1LYK1_9LACO|nr:ABC transporter ATP-binding protein [Liquorilactobacillus capillatus]KRL00473.1 ABC transporter, ATP-binding protein [Liquorilactobacillus capillatus DSM 19910]